MVDSPVLTKKADVYSFGIVVWEFVGAPEAPFSHLKTPYLFEVSASFYFIFYDLVSFPLACC